MKMKALWVTLLFWPVISCSVKESRDGAPCWIYEDSGSRLPVSLSLWENGIELTAMVMNEHKVYQVSVDRGIVTVLAASEHKMGALSGGKYMLHDGLPADSIFIYRKILECTDEWIRDTVCCHKQFASVHLFLDIAPSHPWYPDSLRIESSWSGLDILNAKPVEGSYSYKIPSSDTCLFRILRQGDDNLNLTLIGGDGGTLDRIPLGRLMENAGYDWQDEDLKDIEITLTEAGADMKIIIDEWRSGGSSEFDI